MYDRDLLTEDEVIEGVVNFLKQKGRTKNKTVSYKSSAEHKEHGVDLVMKLANPAGKGNMYFIKAKGNKKADGSEMASSFNTFSLGHIPA